MIALAWFAYVYCYGGSEFTSPVTLGEHGGAALLTR
jgi:hypothetical protein